MAPAVETPRRGVSSDLLHIYCGRPVGASLRE